ncbi:protein aveugle [Diorhabda carinulata]|uniref:protein aveugle n=1 Tax=Diorhabda sublineata TaxID=1163346 RepID=UPI0024E0740C|nr:protein aveugle [Diorhabda sublineata]XP_057662417.1 protein aveugle [Diorhabda carinulata]
MVEARTEEVSNTTSNTKVKATNTKPKSVYSWNVVDVQKWLRRHCSDYYHLYVDNFNQHEITGRSLLRINDNSLLRLGITNDVHREAIWKQILKLRLKTDIVEIRDIQRRNMNNMYYDNSLV